MDEVRMDLPCTALSIDLETTGCWPGVHKIVAVGVALFQLHPSHQVVEVERRLFQFKVNYPQDFDEITLRDFWHVQGRMDLLATLQKNAKPEEEAIKDFYDFYTEVCYRYPKFFLVTDNPVMDLGFLNLSIATKLGKPPLTYRPVQRCSASSLAPPELRLPWCSELAPPSLDSSSSSLATRTSSSTTLSSESESDDEFSTTSVGEEDSSEGSDEEAFGESGEEDISADEATNNHTSAVNEQLLLKANELAQRVQQLQQQQQQQPASCGTGKRLASFYDDYSAPHFAVDLNSFACGLIGLHLPPFRRAGGSRWASPADFLSFHKPYLVCPYRKTHDPVDDASSNCWHFLQCISILWVNEYTQIHQARKDEQHHQQQQQQQQQQHQHTKSCGGGGGKTSASGGGKPPVYSDADFPTISSANKQQQQQQRSPRRGRTPSASPTSSAKDKATSPPPRGAKPQQQQQQRQHQGKAGGSSSNNSSSPVKSLDAVPRRTMRSFSDPPFVDTVSASSSFSASSLLSPSPASPPPPTLVLF